MITRSSTDRCRPRQHEFDLASKSHRGHWLRRVAAEKRHLRKVMSPYLGTLLHYPALRLCFLGIARRQKPLPAAALTMISLTMFWYVSSYFLAVVLSQTCGYDWPCASMCRHPGQTSCENYDNCSGSHRKYVASNEYKAFEVSPLTRVSHPIRA